MINDAVTSMQQDGAAPGVEVQDIASLLLAAAKK
jgi:hypothetical protein